MNLQYSIVKCYINVLVGHVPLEVSKLCYYFMCHNGEISGVVEDSRYKTFRRIGS